MGSLFTLALLGGFAWVAAKIVIASGGVNLTGFKVGDVVRIRRGRFGVILPGENPEPQVRITKIDGSIIEGAELGTGKREIFTSAEITSGARLTF